ncbi:MAG: hypothetical protein QM743_02500 [Chitinophagaceae bacterium]
MDARSEDMYLGISGIVCKQVNAESLSFTREAVQGSISLVVGADKLYVSSDESVDTGAQKQQLQKDLDYLKGFLQSVDKKLSNEKFVSNAKPEVIDAERKKQADAQAKIKAIEESLSLL